MFFLTVAFSFRQLNLPIALAATNGLVAAYSFDGGSGSVVQDLSGNANHGTMSGATWTTQGRYGPAAQFDGINDIVNVPDAASLDLTSGMTMMAWVRPTANGAWRTVVLKEASNELVYGLYANDNSARPSTWIRSGNTSYNATGTGAVPLNTWTHLAATYGGGTLRLYVNGTVVTSRAVTVPIGVSASPLRIGGNQIWPEWFAGLIDEVRVYNRSLSQAEIQSDMATPLGAAPPPPDTTPPAASMVSPADGALVASVISISASATDDTAVAGVQFLLDGLPLGAEDGSAPYSFSWDTTTAGNGTHTLSARARDAAGNTATATAVTVTVNNAPPSDTTPPSTSVTSPADGAVVSGTLAVTASASDNVGVAGVQFLLDGANLGSDDTTSPYSVSWNTTGVVNGAHTLQARARDAAGHTSTSSIVTVNVSNGGGGTAALRIDGARRFQTMDGFGVNANVNGWSAALPPAIDRLLTENGAALWRVYIDNTDWETTNDNADPFTFNWSYYNALYSTPRFEQAWSLIGYLNQNGVSGDQIILNFMGPGPAWMGGGRLNMAQADEWVEMILSYVYYARFTRNLSFGRLAPFNESDWDCMEGICADGPTLALVLDRVARRLDGLGLGDLRFIQPDTASADAAANSHIPEMMRHPALMAKVEDFGFHNYAGYDATVPSVIAQSAYADRGFWVTEHVLGETLDLVMVDNLMNHIDAGATAALVFKAYDQQDNHHAPGEDLLKGMLAENGGVYTPRKSFYIMSQVHRFIRPGALRIAADESLAARIYAFHHPVTGQVTILGRNGGGSTTITGSLTNLPPVSRFEMYYTDPSSNFVRLADVAVSNGAFAFTAPANSVFTLTATAAGPPPPPPPPPPGGDTQPPTTAVTSPTGGSTVSAAVTVTADAQDNVGVAAVQFLLDGAPLGTEDSTAPYSTTWDTTQTANGTHVLSARARDAAGNLGTSSGVSVTVSNAANGLVAAYNFDEAGGTALVDRSGRGHHGVISGATWAAGRAGGALRFDGVNDLVTIADAPALDLSSLTIMAWVNPSAIGGSWRTVVLKEGPGELAYALYANEGAGHPGTWVRQGATSYSTVGPTAVATNTWTHLAATYGGGTLRLFVNGALVSSRALSITVNATSQPLRIGGNMVWSEWFAGLMDDVRIYDRSLDAAEIQNAMGTPVH